MDDEIRFLIRPFEEQKRKRKYLEKGLRYSVCRFSSEKKNCRTKFIFLFICLQKKKKKKGNTSVFFSFFSKWTNMISSSLCNISNQNGSLTRNSFYLIYHCVWNKRIGTAYTHDISMQSTQSRQRPSSVYTLQHTLFTPLPPPPRPRKHTPKHARTRTNTHTHTHTHTHELLKD